LLLRTLGALLLIVGLIVAATWGLRRVGKGRLGRCGEDVPELSVLSTVGLGDRRSLAVVRFGERTLLLGSTAQAITLLAEEHPGDFSAPPARSVADLLQGNDALAEGDFQNSLAFDEELSVAGKRDGTLLSRRSAPTPDVWRQSGGER
jgi:flagellar biosynthetic protein FliO